VYVLSTRCLILLLAASLLHAQTGCGNSAALAGCAKPICASDASMDTHSMVGAKLAEMRANVGVHGIVAASAILPDKRWRFHIRRGLPAGGHRYVWRIRGHGGNTRGDAVVRATTPRKTQKAVYEDPPELCFADGRRQPVITVRATSNSTGIHIRVFWYSYLDGAGDEESWQTGLEVRPWTASATCSAIQSNRLRGRLRRVCAIAILTDGVVHGRVQGAGEIPELDAGRLPQVPADDAPARLSEAHRK